jgi:glycerophosphoryl diester phosphodiesterase
MIGYSLFLIALNAMTADAAQAVAPQTAAQRVASPSFLVIAHRGDSGAFPENTLPAFRSAVQQGADLVELDYYHSADGVPFVFHDKTLNRTSDATAVLGREKIPAESLAWQDLQRLDAGAWFDERFRGTKIPSLEEALDAIQQGSITLIERKGGDAATCITLLREKQLLDHVVVQSFDWRYVSDCHRLAPDLVLAALGSKELTAEKLDEIEADRQPDRRLGPQGDRTRADRSDPPPGTAGLGVHGERSRARQGADRSGHRRHHYRLSRQNHATAPAAERR